MWSRGTPLLSIAQKPETNLTRYRNGTVGSRQTDPLPSGLISISSLISHGALTSIGSPSGSSSGCSGSFLSGEEKRLRIHGIHSFANSALATANYLGRKGAFELRSLVRKRNQTNQLQCKLLTSGPGGRRFKSSLPDQSFCYLCLGTDISRSFSCLSSYCDLSSFGTFRYIRYN
jgi:hypothetical protein